MVEVEGEEEQALQVYELQGLSEEKVWVWMVVDKDKKEEVEEIYCNKDRVWKEHQRVVLMIWSGDLFLKEMKEWSC